jgi:hypothetical protein
VKVVDEAGNGILEPIIDHVHMTARFSGEQPVEYDSGSNAAPPRQFLRIGETIGKPLAELKISPNGELLKATSLHPSVQIPHDEEPQTADEDAPKKNGATIQASSVDPNLNFLVVFPEEPIRTGHSWKDRLVIKVNVGDKLQRDVELTRRYTLDKVEGDLATISSKISVLTPVNDPLVRGQLIQRTPSGTIVFDMKKGIIVSRQMSLDKVEVGVAGNDSSVRAVSERTERMLSPAEVAERVARKDAVDEPDQD